MFRDKFFESAPEITFEEVQTPAGPARVYMLTAGEKDAFDLAHAKADGKHFRARLLVATVRDQEGHPAFTDVDLGRIANLPMPVVEPLVKAAIRINRMQDDEAEAVRKNS